jgi:hypothetical protein
LPERATRQSAAAARLGLSPAVLAQGGAGGGGDGEVGGPLVGPLPGVLCTF